MSKRVEVAQSWIDWHRFMIKIFYEAGMIKEAKQEKKRLQKWCRYKHRSM